MSARQRFLSDVVGVLVSRERLLCCGIALVCNCILCNVPIVVTFHLEQEDLGLFGVGLGDQVLLQKGEDILADASKLLLNLLLIVLDLFNVLSIALVVLLLLD